jgi:hypothetical protein
VFNTATCFDVLCYQQANTSNTRQKRQIQKYDMPCFLETDITIVQTNLYAYRTSMVKNNSYNSYKQFKIVKNGGCLAMVLVVGGVVGTGYYYPQSMGFMYR